MTPPQDIPVAILCGGRGTRLQEHAGSIPKPLVEVGGRPIVWHVVQLFAVQGFREILLLTGHLGEQVDAFAAAAQWPAGIRVTCVDTGPGTPTGGRIARVAERLSGGTCCVTYGDGVADIDLRALVDGHVAAGLEATMTLVRPQERFGVAELAQDGRISGFREKPRSDHWVNGGFLCLEPTALARIGRDDVLEEGPLQQLAHAGQLRGHRHEGFWACMDTYKDAIELNDLYAKGGAPWRTW
ncbi:MAG: NTP transferase domain-containing protein [Actinobacteria bacterium]|nr:NTP transferase domain-containing protein [Actinomycetota bacterium]